MESQANKKKFFNISSMDFLGAIKPKISKAKENMSKDLIKKRANLTLQASGN